MAGSKERFFDLGSSSDTEDYGDTDSLRYTAFIQKMQFICEEIPCQKFSCSCFFRILFVAQFPPIVLIVTISSFIVSILYSKLFYIPTGKRLQRLR
jgi:hypothetical protein